MNGITILNQLWICHKKFFITEDFTLLEHSTSGNIDMIALDQFLFHRFKSLLLSPIRHFTSRYKVIHFFLFSCRRKITQSFIEIILIYLTSKDIVLHEGSFKF
jgi:hypothetical protein